ncbi:MAG: NDP-sugar synthase [Candidatus Aenigmatarchaeota archaeon]
MKAIILAAGRGTRLRPLTYGIPKPLLPVKGTPMIDWVIRSISSEKIEEIIVGTSGTIGENMEERVLSHIHGICIDSYLKNQTYDCKIRTVPTLQRETGGDLRYILEEINMKKGKIIVVYGDNLTSFNIDKLLDYHEKCKNELGIAGTVVLFESPESDVNRFGIAKLKNVKGFDLVTSFIEKPSLQEAPSRYASAGYYILEVDEVFDMLPHEKVKVEHSVFPVLASQNKLAGYITKLPYWIDISTLEAYITANKMAHDGLIIPPSLPNKGNNI